MFGRRFVSGDRMGKKTIFKLNVEQWSFVVPTLLLTFLSELGKEHDTTISSDFCRQHAAPGGVSP